MTDYPARTKFSPMPPTPYVASTRDPEPAPGDAGACGFCGVRAARSWWPTPLRWSDGADVLLCGSCRRVWRTAGEPGQRQLDRVRAAAYRAACGASWVGMSESPEVRSFRYYAELPGADRAGREEPWSYAPAVIELRRDTFTRWPGKAPEELRPHYEALNAELRTRETAERAARAQEAVEAAKAAEEAAGVGWALN